MAHTAGDRRTGIMVHAVPVKQSAPATAAMQVVEDPAHDGLVVIGEALAIASTIGREVAMSQTAAATIRRVITASVMVLEQAGATMSTQATLKQTTCGIPAATVTAGIATGSASTLGRPSEATQIASAAISTDAAATPRQESAAVTAGSQAQATAVSRGGIAASRVSATQVATSGAAAVAAQSATTGAASASLKTSAEPTTGGGCVQGAVLIAVIAPQRLGIGLG